MKFVSVILFVIAAFVLAGCDGSDASGFIAKAAQGGVAEIQLGQLAHTRATNPDLKNFASRLVLDHTKTNNELNQLASRKGLAMPRELSSEHKVLVDKLTQLPNPEFDRAYADAMIADHQKDVDLYKKQAESGTDPDVKAFAVQTLPSLQEHLKMSQEVRAKL